jgi:hypothetical protein
MDWIERLKMLELAPMEGPDFSPLTEEEIRDIERAVGARLPVEYRLFLSRFGPSIFEKDVVFPTSWGGCSPGGFLGREIKELITDYGDRYPARVIPINDDGGDNMIVISLRDDSYGAIYFQNHCEGIGEPPEDPKEVDAALCTTLFALAPDFASYICGLDLEAK